MPGLVMAVAQYKKIGISVSKIVMGQPWYGYDYSCISNTSGTPCVAMVGGKNGAPQLGFSDAMKLLKSQHSATSLIYNATTVTNWFDCVFHTA